MNQYSSDMMLAEYDVECASYAYESTMVDMTLGEADQSSVDTALEAVQKTNDSWFTRFRKAVLAAAKKIIDLVRDLMRSFKAFLGIRDAKREQEELKKLRKERMKGAAVGAAAILIPASALAFWQLSKNENLKSDVEKARKEAENNKENFENATKDKYSWMDKYNQAMSEIQNMQKKLDDAGSGKKDQEIADLKGKLEDSENATKSADQAFREQVIKQRSMNLKEATIQALDNISNNIIRRSSNVDRAVFLAVKDWDPEDRKSVLYGEGNDAIHKSANAQGPDHIDRYSSPISSGNRFGEAAKRAARLVADEKLSKLRADVALLRETIKLNRLFGNK